MTLSTTAVTECPSRCRLESCLAQGLDKRDTCTNHSDGLG